MNKILFENLNIKDNFLSSFFCEGTLYLIYNAEISIISQNIKKKKT